MKSCHSFDAPREIDFAGFSDTVNDFTSGLTTAMRPDMPGYSSEVLCVVIAVVLLVVFNIKQVPRYFSTLLTDLTSVRPRGSIFDEHTLNETRIQFMLILMVCLSEALLMMSGLSYVGLGVPPAATLKIIGVLMGITVVFYFTQVLAYTVIGYAFTTPVYARLWVRGFTASQVLLGCALLLPALAVMFYPTTEIYVLPVAICLYFLARLAFIIKGIRIFYHNFSSTLYFILYLCSAEIVPVIIVCTGAYALCQYLIT